MVREVVHKYRCWCDVCKREVEPKDLHLIRLDSSADLLIEKDLCADCANRVAEAIQIMEDNVEVVAR